MKYYEKKDYGISLAQIGGVVSKIYPNK